MNKLIVFLLLCASNAWSTTTFTPAQEERIQALIKETLLQHPDILVDAAQAYNQQAQGKMDERVRQVIAENKAFLYQDALSPHWGNKQPTLTLVAFTDYNCPYCKQFDPALIQIVKDFPQVAVVIKFLPYRSQSSLTAARDALSVWAQQPEKFAALNQWLMAKKGYHDDASIAAALKKAGVTVSGANEQSLDTIKKSLAMAEQLGIQGTPATLIGDQLLPGYVPYDTFKALVSEQLAKQ